MVVRNECETVESNLVNGIDGLKNSRHPLETLINRKQFVSINKMNHKLRLLAFKTVTTNQKKLVKIRSFRTVWIICKSQIMWLFIK
jgi:hypothetical protein